MQLYMLDTNVISALMRSPAGPIRKCIADVGADAIVVSIVTAAELRFGCAKRGSEKLTRSVEAILGSLSILPLQRPVDQAYADIRSTLERAGTPIGPNDLLIAAHARSNGAVLITDNESEFGRVPDLMVQNWMK